MNSSEPLPKSPASSSATEPLQPGPFRSEPLSESSNSESLSESLPLESPTGSNPVAEELTVSSADNSASASPDNPHQDALSSSTTADQALILARQHPIPPPSEARQYRAIGLVRGQYVPSEEQFTRGTILAADGTKLEAVLLGRVMSLVKKHLSLEESHLWVTYPRTRDREGDLHLQIVGVWEP
ncbi:MAG: hypothetical protein SFW36_03695, partial [Leptolyngbyaceae cyanobacterium bins.59]|nr:hypothetical protein [Leptolyngbyaceae cyanobacterium bins.59]